MSSQKAKANLAHSVPEPIAAGVDAQGTFAPKGVLNRAQTAVIYTRLKKAVIISAITSRVTSVLPAMLCTSPKRL